MHKEPFFDHKEAVLGAEFQENGYVIVSVDDQMAFDRIRKLVAETAGTFLGQDATNTDSFLNSIHERLTVERLNDLRLDVIRGMNSEPWFRPSYYKLVRPALSAIVGNELAMQMRINLSIQLPQDDGSLLPVHADVWSGDSPYEVVVWLPLVDCYQTKSMFLLPPEVEQDMRKRFSDYARQLSLIHI